VVLRGVQAQRLGLGAGRLRGKVVHGRGTGVGLEPYMGPILHASMPR
jgi:hypothetical protein